jgi:nucleotide-binding universal stress UspA family protein
VDGDAALEILRLAKESKCDLIVLGTHGRTGLSRLVVGSVAEQILRNATCPVLTVKSPQRDIESPQPQSTRTARVAPTK